MPDRPWKILQFVRGSERYGASTSIRNLCWELRARGHEVVLGVYKGRSVGGEMGEKGFRVVELEPHSKFNLKAIFRIRDLFLKEKPDLVHTHLSAATLDGTLAARLAKIPVVSTVHGMNRRWTYSFANHLIAVSEAGKRNLVLQGVRSSKISVAYNGIPIPPEDLMSGRSAMRSSLGLTPENLVLATVSRADHGKGIQDAIDAVAILRRRFPTIHYLFAGEGEYLEELKSQTAALGLQKQVSFLGFREDVFEVLSGTDIFLFPSLKEAMGISIVEAMAMALPVVGTKIGGIPEVVDEASGSLVPANDAPALAEACVPILESPELRASIGAHGRERAEKVFSLAASAEAVEAIYRKVLAAR